MTQKVLLLCVVILCTIAPHVEMCRSLKAGCWFDSSCCTGLCQGFRCRISEQLFQETENFFANAQPKPNTRRKVTI